MSEPTCIKCHRNEAAKGLKVCTTCYEKMTGRLPPFPTFEFLLAQARLRRIGTWNQP